MHAFFSIVASCIPLDNPFPFSPDFDIQAVSSLAQSFPSHSWEFGTTSQALLELYNSSLSLFSCDPFNADVQPYGVHSLKYVQQAITISEDSKNTLANSNGAVGDLASLGVAAVMLGRSIPMYREAADRQLNFVVNEAPRYWNGAISHCVERPELWADFTYMAPPFIAYYSIIMNNLSLLQQSVDQCCLYREILRAELYSNLWRHILNPSLTPDGGLWSTGNAWAAAGMTRVLATVMKAPEYLGIDPDWRANVVESLTTWIKEILDVAIASPTDQGLLRNYLDDTWDNGHGFGEISGSSLLAAVAYCMVVLRPEACGRSYVN
ncbi:hypothetical protein V5O48_017453 [Marasmius crinis-equi]|uniref:Six-hairpin glycosidase-like protein n=1 Tax=Marasmius crinis-equi TaxID=585013 RepID=A0ABR3ENY8_9AGAR